MPLTATLDVRMSKPEAEVVREALLRLRSLPPSLAVVQRALDRMQDAFCTNDRLQSILSNDPASAAGLLRLANSPYFGVGTRVRTLSAAITVVGHVRLQTLLRHLIVGRLFETITPDHDVARRLRERALASGVVCNEIGSLSPEDDANELRVAGLMYNIGEMALACELPVLYQRACALAESGSHEEAVFQVFRVDYHTISGWLLEAWRFPRVYVEAVSHRTEPEAPSPTPGALRYVRTVHVAAALAQAWDQEESEDDAVARISESALQTLGLPQADVRRIYCKLSTGVEQLRNTMQASSHRRRG